MKILIVNYHYFREDVYDNGIYPTNKKNLKKQIDILSKNYDFISQNDLIDIISCKSGKFSKNLCMLTFDDGLKEQIEAYDFLYQLGIPSTFYITTKAIKDYVVLNVHKLHYIRTLISDEELLVKIFKYFSFDDKSFDLNILNNQYRYDNIIQRKIKYFLNFILSPIEKTKFLSELFTDFESNELLFSKNLYMSISELKKLSQENSIGYHGFSHDPLGTMKSTDREFEIEASQNFFRVNFKNSVHAGISYPFGGKSAVSNDLKTLCRKYKLPYGLTMQRGINNYSDLNNKYFLKRVDTNDAPGGKYYK